MAYPLLAPLLALPILLMILALGHRLAAWCVPARVELPGRTLFALALGCMALSYALAAAGLMGQLRLTVVITLWAVGLVACARDLPVAYRAVAGLLSRLVAVLRGPDGAPTVVAAVTVLALLLALTLYGTGAAGVGAFLVAGLAMAVLTGFALWRPGFGLAWLLVAWCVVMGLAALAPPADMDWDGLAEHLAQAKVYARTGRYSPLWYDHHSHFPSLTQMLFSLGLMLHGPGLAKLFHWGFGVLALGAAYAIARCHIAPGAGKWSAAVLASTPIFGFLMQVGYVDLTTMAYSLLAALGFLTWRRDLQPRLLVISGLMAAGAMAAKMQGLALFGVLVLAVAVSQLLRRAGMAAAVRAAVVFALVGGGVASPWYVKSWITTGNPVYPFAYGVFGGKYWGPEEARAYEYHQKEFGPGHLPPAEQYWKLSPGQRRFIGPRSPLNLLLAPWNVTVNPVPFTDLWRQGNRGLLPVLFTAWIGPLYLASLLVLAGLWVRGRVGGVFRRELPLLCPSQTESGRRGAATTDATTVLLGLFLPLWVWWLMSMQYARYLMGSLALLAPVAAGAWARVERGWLRVIPTVCVGAGLLAACRIAAPALTVVSGLVPQEEWLRAVCPVYGVSTFLNRVVPPEGKVILYGEPRGFYIDRDYLWGDPGHHRLIPYERLKTARDLLAELRRMGVTHVLINQRQTGTLGPDSGPPLSLLYQATVQGLARPLFDDQTIAPGYLILSLQE